MKIAYVRALLLVLAVMTLFPSLSGQFVDYAMMLLRIAIRS